MAKDTGPVAQSVADDFLKCRVMISAPDMEEALVKRFKRDAVAGKEGGIRTILMNHDETESSAYATKTRLGQWKLRLTVGNEEQQQEALGRFKGIEGVKEAAAQHLAASVMEAKEALKHAQTYQLKATDVLSVSVGETDRTIRFNAEAAGDNGMYLEFDTPMPAEFKVMYDRYIDSAKVNEESGVVRIGDHVSGYIRADQDDKGRWLALGQGDVEYRRQFDSDATSGEIVEDLAQDLASLEMSESMVLNQVRRHGINANDVRYVEMAGQVVYDVEEDAPSAG